MSVCIHAEQMLRSVVLVAWDGTEGPSEHRPTQGLRVLPSLAHKRHKAERRAGRKWPWPTAENAAKAAFGGSTTVRPDRGSQKVHLRYRSDWLPNGGGGRLVSPAWRSCCASVDLREQQLVGPLQVTPDARDLDGTAASNPIDEALILVGVAASGRNELRRYPLVLTP